MRIDPRALIAPALALLALVLVFQQTTGALRRSGAWREPARRATPAPPDPYARLDQLLARPLLDYPEGRPDPFGYTPAPQPVAAARPAVNRPATPQPPPPPPAPVLTAILWDDDPRATIRYSNRDFTVRENTLFAEFRVRSITSTQVVLDRNGEPLVLTLRPKGE